MRRLLLTLSLLLSLPATAQQLWIEQHNGNAQLHFGDFGRNVRERSPGRLDMLVAPQAQVATLEGDDPLTLRKTADAFDLGVRIRRGEVLLAQDTQFPGQVVQEGGRAVRTAVIPAARFVPDLGPQEPELALDIFPTRHAGQFKVVFLGQPLPGATVVVMDRSGWSRELTTNAEGLIEVALPWKGLYAMEVHHADDRPGQRPGATGPDPYDAASFITTLTFVKPTGAAPPPSVPVTAPAPLP